MDIRDIFDIWEDSITYYRKHNRDVDYLILNKMKSKFRSNTLNVFDYKLIKQEFLKLEIVSNAVDKIFNNFIEESKLSIENNQEDKEVWLKAWMASRTSGLIAIHCDESADQCLKSYKERFSK
jgi:hypothetical protein